MRSAACPHSPQKGRPRLAGKRLPPLEPWRASAATQWTPLTVPRWDSAEQRVVEVVWQTALWYHTHWPPVPIRGVLMRDPQGQFPTQALLCTDLEATPLQILSGFVLRGQLEGTFHAARAHLGIETQRPWSERAIARTTPALLGLFSLVALLAHEPLTRGGAPLQQTAWYPKTTPTFSDALALGRRRWWTQATVPTFPGDADVEQVPRALLDHLADLLCYAA